MPRRRQSIGTTLGAMVAGFEQAILRTTPPAQEMVEHARPDAPVAAGDGTLVSIEVPGPVPPDADAPSPSGVRRARTTRTARRASRPE